MGGSSGQAPGVSVHEPLLKVTLNPLPALQRGFSRSLSVHVCINAVVHRDMLHFTTQLLVMTQMMLGSKTRKVRLLSSHRLTLVVPS